MSTKNFSMKNSTLIVGGAIIEGFDSGESIVFSKRENQMALTVGADGNAIANFNNDESATLTINLLQSTASGAVLSAIANAQRLAGGGGIPVLWTSQTGTVIEMSSAYVEKDADESAGSEHQGKSWVLVGIANLYQHLSV